MSAHGIGSNHVNNERFDLANGADLDRTARPTVIEGSFGVNSRNAMFSLGANRMLNNNFSIGAEGGVSHLDDYSYSPRGFVGANATGILNNPHGADPYASVRYTAGFGPGGLENRVGGRLGISAPLGSFNLGMFVGVDRAIGTPVTTTWNTNFGMTIGFRHR